MLLQTPHGSSFISSSKKTKTQTQQTELQEIPALISLRFFRE